MRLISWNVAARKRVEPQADALLRQRPDVVALQEVRGNTVNQWSAALGSSLVHFSSTHELLAGRHNFVAVASRWPLRETAATFDLPMPELVLSVVVDAPNRSS